MVELMVALLVFSIGLLGLSGAQLSGKQAGFDALQRSVATALAGDIFERMRANPDYAPHYVIEAMGSDSARLPEPQPNCEMSNCTGPQLAAFDLWQWQHQLLGAGSGEVGTLLSPRACISVDSGRLQVVITWLPMSRTGGEFLSACGADMTTRHQLSLVTFLGDF